MKELLRRVEVYHCEYVQDTLVTCIYIILMSCALQDDNQDQTTVDLARVMFDTAVLRSGYDLKVQSTTCCIKMTSHVHTI